MSTVTGNIKDVGLDAAVRSLRIVPLTSPILHGSSLIYAVEKTIQCDAAGDFSFTVAHGDYWLVAGTARYRFSVPDDDLTHSILDILGPTKSSSASGPTSVSVLAYVADLAALAALRSNIARKLVFVEDGPYPLYYYKHGDATAADGYNVVAPDDDGGRYFGRVMV